MTPRHSARASRGVSVRDAEAMLLALEGVHAGRSYGFPAYLLAGEFFARLRDDGTVLVVQLGSIDDRDVLMRLDPSAFFFTEHYRDHPSVLVRLVEVAPALLADVLAQAHRDVGALRAATPRTPVRRRPPARAPRRSRRPPPN